MPVACAAMQLNPATDWMYTADPGKAGLGLTGRRVPVPRGKMLGGSSALNYMAYVRGHPGDFDSWAEGGATGWSYADVLPYFRKSEGLEPSDEIVIDEPAHSRTGPLGVSVRSPVLPGARSSSRQPRLPASRAVITMGETDVVRRVWCRSRKRPRERVRDRAPIAHFWKARRRAGLTSRLSLERRPGEFCLRVRLDRLRLRASSMSRLQER
jgi:choline dehydrogenase-like flavoprotein